MTKEKKRLQFLLQIGLISLIFLPQIALGADLATMVNKIFKEAQTAMTTIGTLVIVGVGIYFLKNLERWKEIFVTCVGIVVASLLIMNAQSIANWAFIR